MRAFWLTVVSAAWMVLQGGGAAAAATPDFTRLPAEVRSAITKEISDCKAKKYEDGFLTVKDVNGDGIPDYIIDYAHLICDGSNNFFCGSAGCFTQVIVSLPGGRYATVLQENVQGIEFAPISGRRAMILALHGSACGRAGSQTCRITAIWNGNTFQTTSPTRKDRH